MTDNRNNGQGDDVLAGLLKAARKRWAILAAGISLLALLFIFAGTIRTPGARKNPVTVIASRALAVAAAVMLVRIALLTHEDGVPVFFIRTPGAGAEQLAAWLDHIGSRYDAVPLSDVTAYVGAQRYVPGKGVAVVIGAETGEGLRAALEGLGGPAAARRLPVTLLVDESLVAGMAGAGKAPALPDEVDIGLMISAGRAPGGGEAADRGWDDESAIEKIRAVSAALQGSTGKGLAYVMLAGDDTLTLGRIAKATGVEAFFGGDGLNRYGDRENRIRLADITGALAARKAPRTRLRVYTSMYRGNYMLYPVWAWLDLAAPVPGERGG